jgi:hypothetical protein
MHRSVSQHARQQKSEALSEKVDQHLSTISTTGANAATKDPVALNRNIPTARDTTSTPIYAGNTDADEYLLSAPQVTYVKE